MGFMGCLSLCIHHVLTGQPDVRPRVHVWGQAQWLANAGVLMGVGMHGKICMYIESAAVCSVRFKQHCIHHHDGQHDDLQLDAA